MKCNAQYSTLNVQCITFPGSCSACACIYVRVRRREQRDEDCVGGSAWVCEEAVRCTRNNGNSIAWVSGWAGGGCAGGECR